MPPGAGHILPNRPLTTESEESGVILLHLSGGDTNGKHSVTAEKLEGIAQRFYLVFPGWKKQEAYMLMMKAEHFHC